VITRLILAPLLAASLMAPAAFAAPTHVTKNAYTQTAAAMAMKHKKHKKHHCKGKKCHYKKMKKM
jgi:hypothetical protein